MNYTTAKGHLAIVFNETKALGLIAVSKYSQSKLPYNVR